MGQCRKATCYDNAAMESVNRIIKTEALYAKLDKSKVKERRVLELNHFDP